MMGQRTGPRQRTGRPPVSEPGTSFFESRSDSLTGTGVFFGVGVAIGVPVLTVGAGSTGAGDTVGDGVFGVGVSTGAGLVDASGGVAVAAGFVGSGERVASAAAGSGI